MKESTNREKVLKRIRQAHVDPIPNPYPDFRENSDVFNDQVEDTAILFARRFKENKGKLVFCENELDFAEKLVGICEQLNVKDLYCVEEALQDFLLKIDLEHSRGWNDPGEISTVLVQCDALIARTGSVVCTYRSKLLRTAMAFADTAFIYAKMDQIRHDYAETIKYLKSRGNGKFPDMIHCINGPARTFEIECREIIGGLGVNEVYLFLINDQVDE